MRGVDPNGFVFYGNQVGFKDANGVGLLDHDALGTTNSGQLTGLAGNVDFAAPQYPISSAPLAADTLQALGITGTPTAPTMSGLAFTGSISGNTTALGAGGTFDYNGNVAAVYEIIISRDGSNFDPGNPNNRVLRGTLPAGSQAVTWDGKDNAGNNFPVGNNYQVQARTHAGEYHMPLLDAENSTLGGPTFTLQNPPGGTCAFGSCTTAFYDDRGYHTSGPSGSDVGTPGTILCGNNPPATDHSDPLNGYDSSGSQRAYGTDTGGNANVPCQGSFGDVKGLDTWTFFPSAQQTTTLNITNTPPPAPQANDDSYVVTYQTPLVTAAPGVLANDTGTGITVTSNTSPAHGSVTQNADGGFTYTPANGYAGPDSYTYTITDGFSRTSTATVHLMVELPPPPVANPSAGSTPFNTPLVLPVLVNDTGVGVRIVSVTPMSAHGGKLTLNPDGTITYSPAFGFSGTDTYAYTISDSFGQTTSALVTIDVASPQAVATGRLATTGTQDTSTLIELAAALIAVGVCAQLVLLRRRRAGRAPR
jgi:hypothetical protein